MYSALVSAKRFVQILVPALVYQFLMELRTLFDKIPKNVRIKELPVDVKVIQSERRKKTVSLEVYPAEVVIRVPKSFTRTALYDLLDQRKSWLLDKWREIQSRTPATSGAGSQSILSLPTEVYIHGNPHSLILRRGMDNHRFQIRLENELIIITVPEQTESRTVEINMTRKLMVSWLQKLARRDFTQRLQTWAEQMNVTYRGFRLKDQKTRWGSCSSLGNINLNWRLIQAPAWVIDYVVVHELAHLEELNHSKAFWSIVSKHCPKYREAKIWLKANGQALQGL